ncbi:hypothetical protein HanRHA438_Chr08g0354201 [Helianthus annuus]|uniref:Uncharacterized protein n=1 Tax=Helianthus annuus TaxID=4232 RepID=A0A251U7C6_HELAN|nr:hypothetical protein HanXRQr2_Chr08g0342781 [Helianthus annuus]KAJ0539160.1 hypothetical protein HanHA300_Chr08g0283201 [Helianthus annuus]KAJ0547238.1 hypothetical protein HanIR_Chr08g0369961 [Helianthus annuus]KAJ0553810.1 hypothetical protein HanHA89_Chr08g0300591 [Helianthus annuus]KAJ0719469.1 hypothetical protein HanLR1_Chr08g0282121 [Helianthus annuus]
MAGCFLILLFYGVFSPLIGVFTDPLENNGPEEDSSELIDGLGLVRAKIITSAELWKCLKEWMENHIFVLSGFIGPKIRSFKIVLTSSMISAFFFLK